VVGPKTILPCTPVYKFGDITCKNRLSDLWVNPKPAYLRGLVVNYRKAFKAIDRLLVQAESFFDRHVKPRRKVV
jgi:hypothetical protein